MHLIAATPGLSLLDALILGVVEGITEYLPISSTGHLYVTGQLLHPHSGADLESALKTYEIVIQAGAILAVVTLYRKRLAEVIAGLVGRTRGSESRAPELSGGRRIALALIVAFLPAALLGLLFDDAIKEHLFSGWPVAAAFALGGVAILAFRSRLGPGAASQGLALEQITLVHAGWIGAAQALSLWPGTSRSLVTILAAVLSGLSLAAAVEFSFLLGLGTLGAATAYSMLDSGSELVSSVGWPALVVGLAVSFATAMVAVRWMVAGLQRNGLRDFGWYRLGAAAVTGALLIGGVIR